MSQVLIRNLDPEVVDRLKRQAEAEGLSLEAFLRQVVSEKAGGTRAEFVAAVEALRRKVEPPEPGQKSAQTAVREMRDERSFEIDRRPKR